MNFTQLLNDLTLGFQAFTWGNAFMLIVGAVLIYLAVAKEYEPVLLLPIGFGCVLANLGMSYQTGLMKVIYDAPGSPRNCSPLLIFIGVGAMIDFRPLCWPCLRWWC